VVSVMTVVVLGVGVVIEEVAVGTEEGGASVGDVVEASGAVSVAVDTTTGLTSVALLQIVLYAFM